MVKTIVSGAGHLEPRPGFLASFARIKPAREDYLFWRELFESAERPFRLGAIPLRSEGGAILPNPRPLIRDYAHIIKPGGRVVEFGPGLGRNAHALLDRGFNVTVVEPTEKSRSLLREFAGKWGTGEQLSITSGTYQDHDLAGGRFDALISTGSSHFMGKQEVAAAFFDKARTHLEKEGLIFLDANNFEDQPNSRASRGRIARGEGPLWLPKPEDVLALFPKDRWEILYFEPNAKDRWRGMTARKYNEWLRQNHPDAPEVAERSRTRLIARKR